MRWSRKGRPSLKWRPYWILRIPSSSIWGVARIEPPCQVSCLSYHHSKRYYMYALSGDLVTFSLKMPLYWPRSHLHIVTLPWQQLYLLKLHGRQGLCRPYPIHQYHTCPHAAPISGAIKPSCKITVSLGQVGGETRARVNFRWPQWPWKMLPLPVMLNFERIRGTDVLCKISLP